jgi:hypothetical protein
MNESLKRSDVTNKLIGKRVTICDDSMFRQHAYMNKGNGHGTVSEVLFYIINNPVLGYDPRKNRAIVVVWDNGYKNRYREIDLSLESRNEIKMTSHIRWYKNGKLENEK